MAAGRIIGLGVRQLELRQLGIADAVRHSPNANVFHPSKSPLRQGSYRALAATANHFAREMHMDDDGARARRGRPRVPPEEPEERTDAQRS